MPGCSIPTALDVVPVTAPREIQLLAARITCLQLAKNDVEREIAATDADVSRRFLQTRGFGAEID